MQSWKTSTCSPSVVVKILRQVLCGMAESAAYRAAALPDFSFLIRTHPSLTSRITQSCAVLLGMPAAFWISVTVKKPASCVNWRIRRRYSRRCSSTLAIVVADVQDIADDRTCRLYRSCTFANQRDLLCHIGLEGERIQRSFDHQRVALLDKAGG